MSSQTFTKVARVLISTNSILIPFQHSSNTILNHDTGWIKSDGDQIAKQMISAVKSSLGKERFIEVLFDPVPNLDEVAFGTAFNKKLRLEVAANLNVPEYGKLLGQ